MIKDYQGVYTLDRKELLMKEDLTYCSILSVNVNVTNMQDTTQYILTNIETLRGKYICVSNVHTTVMAFEDEIYRNIQNESAMTLPDGKPLSLVSKMRGYKNSERVAGPNLMPEIFGLTQGTEYSHYFYGSTEDTLSKLRKTLKDKYPNLKVAGMYSPPFRILTEEEDKEIVESINKSKPDYVWVGLGAPKQERWMYEHRDKVNGVMIGVGAGFDFHAGTVKRAPKWVQALCLEWFYRLLQDPKRLWKRYVKTNFKFILLIRKENREHKNRKYE